MSTKRINSFWREKANLQIQTILFNSDFGDICRTVEALDRSVSLAIVEKAFARTVLVLGDGSPEPVLSEEQLQQLRALSAVIEIRYDFFDANLGTAAGHNRMVAHADESTDFIWIQNPDVVVMPRLFEIVMASFKRPDVGQVEAKQLPIEHPKDYDPSTGETDWTTTACVMTPKALFDELGGFDADSFFMYCDDVDFAFRIREAGYKTIFQPAAVCFHDKRLSAEGGWQPTNAEQYFSAEAALIMAHKWSYPKIGAKSLAYFQNSGEPNLLKAAKVFEERRAAGTLPAPRDSNHRIAHFHEIFYAKHRYSL
jgi:GT2 family glycosyltransferase